MRNLFLAVFILGFGFQFGCAGAKKAIESGQPTDQLASVSPAAESTAVPTQVQAPVVQERYQVIKGDCLWKISAKVYQDAFKWVLIFKANRDQIQDPDLIYPRQILSISRGQSPEETLRAKDLALKTPKYRPHTRPRTKLPLNYF